MVFPCVFYSEPCKLQTNMIEYAQDVLAQPEFHRGPFLISFAIEQV